jgi:hypothetical protein
MKDEREKIRNTTYDISTFPTDLEPENIQSQTLWYIIQSQKCPSCNKTDGLYEGPRGGLAVNIICKYCTQRYWVSAIAFGAYVLPKQNEIP